MAAQQPFAAFLRRCFPFLVRAECVVARYGRWSKNLRDLLLPVPWSESGGGQASSFLDGIWNYASGYNLHRDNIKFGIPGTQMIAWGSVLKDEQIEAVLNFILEREKEMGVTPPPPNPLSETEHYNLKVEVLAEGLEQPWGIEFIDDRTAVFCEFPGRLRLLVDRQVAYRPIANTPKPATRPSGQSFGFMDVALHPNYAENGWIYLCYIDEVPEIVGDEPNRRSPLALFEAVSLTVDG